MHQPLPPRSADFSDWYNQLVLRADLADYAPVRGCMIVKPYGWALWENMQAALDRRFKATGHVNAAFPLFIPMSFLEKEKEHVAGFSPELAVVTIGGGETLAEPLVVRPTSEAVVGHAYSQWIKSYRDLPLLINQWCNVVRWEMRTKLFLRTLEFWWQEGHTAHATHDEAEEETRRMLDVYTDFAANEAALPVIPGLKSEAERFAGALRTYTLEAMMGDKRALQVGTSHNLGQNFARAFNIQFLDRDNELRYCWTTSWGVSTRLIGAIIMVHGDDQGLMLPPRLAPIQAVLVPIFKNDAEKGNVMEVVARVQAELAAGGVRVHVDSRDGLTPGFKFNDWEMRGVPLRVEVGPKDVAQGTVALARRDLPGKAGKSLIPQTGLTQAVRQALDEVHAALYARALAFREANTFQPKSYDEFRQIIEAGGFCQVWWAGDAGREAEIKEETKATLRCFPLEQPGGHGPCIGTGRKAEQVAIFARAY